MTWIGLRSDFGLTENGFTRCIYIAAATKRPVPPFLHEVRKDGKEGNVVEGCLKREASKFVSNDEEVYNRRKAALNRFWKIFIHDCMTLA